MPWQQIKINVKAADAEAVGDALSELHAQAVSFIDAKDTPVYEPKPGEVLLWPDTQVIGLYDADIDLKSVIESLSAMDLFSDSFNYALDQLEDKEWEREWMDDFHPMRFGRRLWICPSWRDAPDPSAVNIKLDPGLAFGTGTHPTTSLCLRWLDEQNIENKNVIDFGCGSGILGVAALKLGAAAVIGIDIDPQALIASKQNALNNGVEHKLALFLPEHQPNTSVDIVLANILAGPLKELNKTISDFCKPEAYLVMSGILLSQANEVMTVYEKDFLFEPIAAEGEWVRLVGQRRATR